MPKRKRQLRLACDACHQSKQACDRKYPCTRCFRSAQAHTCAFESDLEVASARYQQWPVISALKSLQSPAARVDFHRGSEMWVSMNGAMARELGMSTQLMAIVADAGLGPL